MSKDISIFETRTMLEPIEQNFAPRTFLLRMFFPEVKTFESESVDLDYVKGSQSMAPFVGKRYGSKTVERTGYTTKSYKPPMVAPDMVTEADNLLNRSPGENIYTAKTPQERASEQLGKDLADLDDMITRREEWMCSQTIFNGQVNVVGPGVSDVIMFWDGVDDPYMELTGTDLWTDSGSNPLSNLRAWKREISLKSGFTPTVVVMGARAVDAFIDNAALQKSLDNRRITLGQIKPEDLEPGVTYYGNIEGLDFYGYDAQVFDDVSGEMELMVPEDLIVVGSPGQGRMLYGAVAITNEKTEEIEIYASPRVPDTWVTKKPAGRTVAMKSKPLPNPGVVDSMLIVKVV